MKQILFFTIVGGLFFSRAFSEEVKKDLGVGPLVVVGHHYRGSDQGKIWIFPIPYFSYKSSRLEAEPSFVRGILFHNPYFEFKLSLVPGLNVESKKNRAREGMPSLDYSLEAGPMAIVHLWREEEHNLQLNFEVPVRESFATNMKRWRSAGLIAVPYFNLLYKPRHDHWNFDLEFSTGPMFASEKYHDRFYTVAPQYATPVRGAYQARGGYSGWQTALVLNKRLHNLALLSFLRWDDLLGVAFAKSPLVKQRHFFIGGLGLFVTL